MERRLYGFLQKKESQINTDFIDAQIKIQL